MIVSYSNYIPRVITNHYANYHYSCIYFNCKSLICNIKNQDKLILTGDSCIFVIFLVTTVYDLFSDGIQNFNNRFSLYKTHKERVPSLQNIALVHKELNYWK